MKIKGIILDVDGVLTDGKKYYCCHDKISVAQEFCDKHGIDMASELCFIGDDVNDIPLLEKVALPIAVGDALPRVKVTCSNYGGFVTKNLGGNGAVREAIDTILETINE